MIIMIIFIVLSIVLSIVTAIYLKRKNNNNTKSISINKNKVKKKNLQKLFDIKIQDGFIYTNNKYSKILKLGSIDYNMLSDQEQDVIEEILIQTALALDYPIQFLTTTEYIDTTIAINEINNNKIQNVYIQKYQENLSNYLNNIMKNKSLKIVANYAIISNFTTATQNIDEIERKVKNFKNSLIRANINCEVLEERDLYDLLYREFNKNGLNKIENLLDGEEKIYVTKKEKSGRKKNQSKY